MTFRTFDIDEGHAALNTDVTATTRTVRRRRSRVTTTRSACTRILGIGF